MDSAYKGWAQLKLLDENDENALVPFVFPLNTEGRYVISSRNSDSVSLLLPDSANPNEKALPIEAVLTVTKIGQVLLERPKGDNAVVSVNGEVIASGAAWRAPVELRSTIAFGPWQLLFCKMDGMFDDQMLEKVSSYRRCNVCRNNVETVYVLNCGHNICPKCRQEALNQQPPGRLARLQPRRNERQAAPGPPVRVLVRQVQDGLGRIQTPLHCISCRLRISPTTATSAVSSVSMNQMAKLLSELTGLDGSRPLCEGCQNRRGLLCSRDYDFCETCQQILCAMCVLQWHRGHKLKGRVERLGDLENVHQKLEDASTKLAAMERRVKEFAGSAAVVKIMNAGHHQGNAMAATMHSLNQRIMQCRQQLNFIKQRKRALSREWDETSRLMAETFNQHVQEYHVLFGYAERLRNGEASLTLSSSSDETNDTNESSPASTTSTTTLTSSATSASPSANA